MIKSFSSKVAKDIYNGINSRHSRSLPKELHNKAYRLIDQINAIPGEMLLKEFLEPLGLSQKSFSDHIGWTYTRLNEIINKRRGITADSALTLAEAFQTEPEFWLNLQSNWDLWHSLKKHRKVKPLNLTRKAA